MITGGRFQILTLTLTIGFQCIGKQEDCKEELNFLQAWLATSCPDEVYIEFATMNFEDNFDDENVI